MSPHFIHFPAGGPQAKLRLLIGVSSLTVDWIRHRLLIYLANDVLEEDGQGAFGKLLEKIHGKRNFLSPLDLVVCIRYFGLKQPVHDCEGT